MTKKSSRYIIFDDFPMVCGKLREPAESASRWYPEHPMVGVGAVVFKEGQMLMVKRSKEPSKGKWSIPGGRLELGETLYEAARREVREECSIEIEIERVIDATDRIIRDEEGRVKYHFVLIDVLASYKSGEIKAQSDVEECRWVVPGELDKLDTTPMLRTMLERAKIL